MDVVQLALEPAGVTLALNPFLFDEDGSLRVLALGTEDVFFNEFVHQLPDFLLVEGSVDDCGDIVAFAFVNDLGAQFEAKEFERIYMPE